MAARWGTEVAALGFTASPNVLLEHLPGLGLSPLDKLLLDLLEAKRRTGGDEAVYPGFAYLAERVGLKERQVRRRLANLVDRGLLECKKRRSDRGRWPHNAYTREGLTRALTLIASNRREGRDDLEGLADLLSELACPPDMDDRWPSSTNGHLPRRPADIPDHVRRSQMSNEVEVLEEEVLEEEGIETLARSDVLSSSSSSAFDEVEPEPRADERERALVDDLVTAFDATQIPPAIERELSAEERAEYARHRARFGMPPLDASSEGEEW